MRHLGLVGLLSLLTTVAVGCGEPVPHAPGARTPPDPSSFTRAYGVQPGTGLSFEGDDWGYVVTADGFGGFSLAMLGDPRYPTLQDRFFGSVYVGSSTVSDLGACGGCTAVTPTAVSATRLDFDALVLGVDQAGFTFKHNGGGGQPVYLDLYVDGSHFGGWKIHFVSSDTGQVAYAPENPLAVISP